jgi:hypothetical protein
MYSDDDLARLLPEPPPPRRNRREEAIRAAMQRYDGSAAAASGAAPRRSQPSTPWWRMPAAQLGALASVVMVAAVSISIALHNPVWRLPVDSPSPSGERAASTATPSAATDASSGGLAVACTSKDCTPTPSKTAGAESLDSADAARAPNLTGVAPTAKTAAGHPGSDVANSPALASRGLSDSAPATPPPAEPVPAAPRPSPPAAEPVVADAQVARRSNNWSAPNADVDRESAGGSDIIVTGTSVNRNRRAYQRGDWNACTVNDPRRTLRGCASEVNTRAKGPAGKAAVKLSDGLSAAWGGDWSNAIRAFDEAIALKPRFALAYLNRGLAYQRDGDLQRAIGDFALAIRYEPNGARNYYSRAMARRSLGDKRGADKDFARAIELDADYRDVIE